MPARPEVIRIPALNLKTRLVTAVLFLSASLASAEVASQNDPDLPRIAHAGGQVDGATYSNSLEALEENYEAGFRAFEIDLSFTSDRELVCLHDWDESFTRSFDLPPGSPVTRQEFERLVAERSDLTKCTLASLMLWFDEHPDAILITDVKEQNLEALEHISTRYPQSLSRIIPQIYQPDEYGKVRAFGFERLIWTLYLYPGGTQSVLDSLGDMTLWAITLNSDRAQEDLPRRLDELGIPTYAHTINQYADLLYLRTLGVDEIYTDTLTVSREAEFTETGRLTARDSALLRAREERESARIERVRRFRELPRIHFGLAPDFRASAMTTNQISDLTADGERLEIVATGNDPYIHFPVLDDPVNELAVYVSLEAPDSTMLEMFYTTEDEPAFSAERRVSERLAAGANEVVIGISESSPITQLRLDPGTVAGLYRIESFEIRSEARSWSRFFRRN